jgi:DNA-directed RNA polymerases I, II, and III subunit RPABC2
LLAEPHDGVDDGQADAGQADASQMNGIEGLNSAEQDHDMINGTASQEQQSVPQTGLTGEQQPNKVRVTTPYLTKYERARILGTRALQIRHV